MSNTHHTSKNKRGGEIFARKKERKKNSKKLELLSNNDYIVLKACRLFEGPE